MEIGKFFLEKKIVISFFIYAVLCGILLFHYGIQTGGEAEKYLDGANRILKGEGLRNGIFGIFYFVYSLFISAFVGLGINLIFVAILQLLFSFLAALALYKLLIRIPGNNFIAFIFFIAYLICYPIQKWNFFLYSESLHISLLVFGIYFFVNLLAEKKFKVFPFIVILILILFSRPTGIIFFMVAGLTLVGFFYRNGQKRLSLGFGIILITASMVILNSPLIAFVNPDAVRRMEVICQVPEANVNAGYQEFNREGLTKVISVIRDEIGIGNFFTTGLKKLGAFFGMRRSYYSKENNFLLSAYWIFYPFALLGLFAPIKGLGRDLKYLSGFYLLLSVIAIFFTCDDWANRFIGPLFPFILILATIGLHQIFRKKVKIAF